MSHSTLTWFSSLIAPKHADELFVLASGSGEVFSYLYKYNTKMDSFYRATGKNARIVWDRNTIGYWAYVPTQIDFHEKLEKQSQVQDS